MNEDDASLMKAGNCHSNNRGVLKGRENEDWREKERK